MRRVGLGMRVMLIAGAAAGWLQAATAMVECTAGAHPLAERTADVTALGGLLLNFNATPAEHWDVKRVVLLIHVASGTAPKRLRAARVEQEWTGASPPTKPRLSAFHEYRVSPQPAGWLEVELYTSVLAVPWHGIAIRAPAGVFAHSRLTVQYTPYVIVEGEPRR